MNRYSAIAVFDKDLDHVVLIEKQKPAWQAGKANFPGGKVELQDWQGGTVFDLPSHSMSAELALALRDGPAAAAQRLRRRGRPCRRGGATMNIYISSSWKNRERVRAFAIALRAQGHEVYDFTDPASRKSPEIPPEAFPEQFDPNKHNYGEYLNAVPNWRSAVYTNLEAIHHCDLCVLLLPCGADSRADWGVAVGLGKRTIVVGHPKAGERTPSHLWAEKLLQNEVKALAYLSTHSPDCRQSKALGGVAVECEHGFDFCPTCDACNCEVSK